MVEAWVRARQMKRDRNACKTQLPCLLQCVVRQHWKHTKLKTKLIQHELTDEWMKSNVTLLIFAQIFWVLLFLFCDDEINVCQIPVMKNKLTQTNTIQVWKKSLIKKQKTKSVLVEFSQLTCVHKCEISWTLAPLSDRPVAQLSFLHARTIEIGAGY